MLLIILIMFTGDFFQIWIQTMLMNSILEMIIIGLLSPLILVEKRLLGCILQSLPGGKHLSNEACLPP